MVLTDTIAGLLIAAGTAGAVLAAGSGNHTHDGDHNAADMLQSMQEMHEGHDHGHDFAAMEGISEDDMHRTMEFLIDIGLVVPPMDSVRGRDIFVDRGCIICHSVNGVGGEVGPSFDAADMPQPMNAFEFAARMWRGAPAMAQMQEDLLGEMISLDGQDLADIIAFVHDQDVQKGLSKADIPQAYRELLP